MTAFFYFAMIITASNEGFLISSSPQSCALQKPTYLPQLLLPNFYPDPYVPLELKKEEGTLYFEVDFC